MDHLLSSKVSVGGQVKGTGWLPPIPDPRDYSERHPKIQRILRASNMENLSRVSTDPPPPVPSAHSLVPNMPRIEDQESLGSCVYNAAIAILEYYHKVNKGRYIDLSRLFSYKVGRLLMGIESGDTGSYMRVGMASLMIFGTLPEKYWPYIIADFDKDPRAFHYAMALKYQALKCMRHDTADFPQECVVNSVIKYIAAGIPAMFAFYGFDSFNDGTRDGEVPFPNPGEIIQWGHGVVAVGYDNNKVITNRYTGRKNTGALQFRNSWGENWGDNGYGWLPYKYVNEGLALDFWSLMKARWFRNSRFGL